MSWINVDDQLPRTNIAVLVKTQDVYVVCFLNDKKEFILDVSGIYATGYSFVDDLVVEFVPTHWMYIP